LIQPATSPKYLCGIKPAIQEEIMLEIIAIVGVVLTAALALWKDPRE